jgi:hypothetical protein
MTKQKPNPGLTPELKAQLDRAGREADVKIELLKLGVSRTIILDLVEKFSLESIEQQLAWLPLRRARKPSSLIVSAIKEGYEEPAAALEQTTASSNSSVYRGGPKQKGNK